MSQIAQIPYISPEDYLAGEAQSPTKHEYRAGQIWAMGGASRAHRAICFSLSAALRAHLKGSGCSVDGMDARVDVPGQPAYYYPDLVVTCHPQAPESLSISNPRVIIEVLSKSTASMDRTSKFADYTTLESLEEYVLIDSRRQSAWIHRRAEGWRATVIPAGGTLSLQAIDFACPLALAYEDVDVPE